MKQPEIVCCGVPFGSENEVEALQMAKDNAITSIQIYVHWNLIEPDKRGEFDFSYYDRQVKLIQQAGLKWVPFLILGPAYALPEWWKKSGRHCGMACLEHEMQGEIESIWNPHWRSEITRVLEAFAAHYLPWNVLESVQPGISGDYGEAIYPAVGGYPGTYHTHYGFWCMDEYAVASFRQTMKDKYGDIASLNAAWRTGYADFEAVRPFKRHKSPSRTALFDLLMWYKASMTDYDEFWMRECQRIFPGIPTYMCTGGDGEPYLGADFAEQARASAKYGGGIRLTNEGNVFRENYQDTIHCVTSCKYYGAYMGLEPVGGVIPRGVTVRMYGSAAYGNRQLFHYYGNLFDGECEGALRQKKYAHLIGERKTEENVAVFLPLDMSWLDGSFVPDNIKLALNYVRRQYETAVINETLIEDGILDNIKVLIMIGAVYTRASVLTKIARWVKNGGVLITTDRTTDIEGDIVPEFDEALGFTAESAFCGGITTFYPTAMPWNKEFTEKDACCNKDGWMKLAADSRPMLSMAPYIFEEKKRDVEKTGPVVCAFEHDFGEGKVVFYGGPLSLQHREDPVFSESDAYQHILSDLLLEYAGVKPLGTKPDEIARTRVNGKIMVLKTDDIFFVEDET